MLRIILLFVALMFVSGVVDAQEENTTGGPADVSKLSIEPYPNPEPRPGGDECFKSKLIQIMPAGLGASKDQYQNTYRFYGYYPDPNKAGNNLQGIVMWGLMSDGKVIPIIATKTGEILINPTITGYNFARQY
jgi:hypothetical protein